MKHFVAALFIFLGASGGYSLGQTIQPFRNANTVLVTFADVGAEDAFDLIGRVLTEQGYNIEQADPNVLTMKTAVRIVSSSFNRTGTTLIIRTSVKSVAARKTQILISGSVGLLGQIPSSEIGYRGVKGSVFMNGFDELQTVADQLVRQSGGIITYIQQ